MHAQSHLDVVAPCEDSGGRLPRARAGRDNECEKIPFRDLIDQCLRVRIEVKMTMEVDHITPWRHRSFPSSSMPRATTLSYRSRSA
jgi:hypothetical protein